MQIKTYPDDRPLPSVLFLGSIGQRPLHVLIAFNLDAKKIFIVTVYEPDLYHFMTDFKTRRK